VTTPDDAALYAEIDRDLRRRRIGVWILLVFAALLALPLPWTMAMMHGDDDYAVVDATIVAVERDPASGELRMTSEFADASGTVHRETETEGYHYAPGPPRVGQRIEYLYRTSDRTGEVVAFPRADRFLQWTFGVPAAVLGLFGLGFGAWLLRLRRQRERLVRVGLRLPAQAPRVRHRALVLPARHGDVPVRMWRLEARYFEPSRSEFIDCHGDWQQPPAPDAPPAATVLVDPERPMRYWLPSA